MKFRSMILLLLPCVFALPATAADSGSGLGFDHALHVEDVGLECGDCHVGVEESASLAERLLPGKPQCEDCHDLDDTDACGTCHLNADEPAGHAGTPSPVDRFSHVAHLAEMECANCHGGAPEYSGAPAKADCRGCHVTAANFEDCSLCHSAGRENVPDSHEGLWKYWHGVEAGSNPDSCGLCHVQDDCQACHSGDNVRPRTHPLNFEFNHSIQARTGNESCVTCHSDPQFCSQCHAANAVLPQTHSVPGWRNGAVHGPEALFEIESCIACHDAGSAVPVSCSGSGCHTGG